MRDAIHVYGWIVPPAVYGWLAMRGDVVFDIITLVAVTTAGMSVAWFIGAFGDNVYPFPLLVAIGWFWLALFIAVNLQWGVIKLTMPLPGGGVDTSSGIGNVIGTACLLLAPMLLAPMLLGAGSGGLSRRVVWMVFLASCVPAALMYLSASATVPTLEVLR